MKDFNNWTEVSKGFYRYVIGSNVCYEIHILYWEKETNILEAKASLYIVGDWYAVLQAGERRKNFFEREQVISNVTVQERIEAACGDYEENVYE